MSSFDDVLTAFAVSIIVVELGFQCIQMQLSSQHEGVWSIQSFSSADESLMVTHYASSRQRFRFSYL